MKPYFRAVLYHPYRTNWWIAGVAALVVFALEWLIPLHVKGNQSTVGASTWGVFLTGEWSCAWGEMLAVLAGTTITFAMVAVVFGWALQCVLVIVTAFVAAATVRRGNENGNEKGSKLGHG